MYGPAAIARRRCKATCADGQPCRAWALWNDAAQRCNVHAGRHHRGKMPDIPPSWYRPRASVTCDCAARPHRHRPGSGDCRWPEPPLKRCTRRPGIRSGPGRSGRLRDIGVRGITAILGMSKREIRRALPAIQAALHNGENIANQAARRRQAAHPPASDPAPDHTRNTGQPTLPTSPGTSTGCGRVSRTS